VSQDADGASQMLVVNNDDSTVQCRVGQFALARFVEAESRNVQITIPETGGGDDGDATPRGDNQDPVVSSLLNASCRSYIDGRRPCLRELCVHLHRAGLDAGQSARQEGCGDPVSKRDDDTSGRRRLNRGGKSIPLRSQRRVYVETFANLRRSEQ
jgi:hypothetical protein